MKPTNASSGSSTLALMKAESADLPTDPVDSRECTELVILLQEKHVYKENLHSDWLPGRSEYLTINFIKMILQKTVQILCVLVKWKALDPLYLFGKVFSHLISIGASLMAST